MPTIQEFVTDAFLRKATTQDFSDSVKGLEFKGTTRDKLGKIKTGVGVRFPVFDGPLQSRFNDKILLDFIARNTQPAPPDPNIAIEKERKEKNQAKIRKRTKGRRGSVLTSGRGVTADANELGIIRRSQARKATLLGS